MYKVVAFLAIFCLSIYGFFDVYAQQPQLATFQETVQILIDEQLENIVVASITLQSSSNQEIKIPSGVEELLLKNDRIVAVVLTNKEQCVLGVQNESCILVNVSRDDSERGIIEIQDAAREIGDSVINDINLVFDTDAQFHSVYVHTSDSANAALETSGVVASRGTISAVYTMPLEATDSMYAKISSILVAKEIRDSGGFYEIAKALSSEPTATMTFSILPGENSFLYQIQLSIDYPNSPMNKEIISPLEFLKIDTLTRSDYFANGFYPLNSILEVVILSSESTNVNQVNTNIIPTQIIGGEKIPKDLSIDGWFFEPESGNIIDGKYLFGQKFSVNKNELIFTLGTAEITSFDESAVILLIIVIVSVAAAAYFLKGYKK